MEIKAPDLDDRTSETVFKQTIELAKHYCPEWAVWLKDPDREQIKGDPGLVMFRLFSKMTEHLIKQMNRIPEKHRIAFLDFMGIDLLPAKPSRVPLTFYLVKKSSGARIPQGTIVAARPTKEMIVSKVPEVLFETGKDLDVVPVRMNAVYSLNPWEDKYTDHSKTASGKEDGFLVFGRDANEIPLDHILYLGDDDLLDIRNEATLTTLTIRLYGENLVLKNYFAKWYVEKDDGSRDPLTPEMRTDIGKIAPLNGVPFVEAKFSNINKINKSKINNIGSFWLSVKPNNGAEIQNPFNWNEIPKSEKNKFLKFIAWNFGSEWENSTVEKINENINISSGNELIELVKNETDNTIELNYNEKTYTFPLKKTVENKLYMHHQPIISKITADVTIENISPVMAFFNETPIDLKKGFFPFGENPKPLDTLYIASEEAFSKKDSRISLNFKIKKGKGTVKLTWEYWNGKEWLKFGTGFTGSTYKFDRNGSISFTCPKIELIKVNGQLNRWIRVRIEQGNYGEPSKFVQTQVDKIIDELSLDATCKDATKTELNTKGYAFGFQAKESTLDPPFITSILIKYVYTNHEIQRIKSYNNFQFKDGLEKLPKFEPYEPSKEKLPALYLGFEKDENLRGRPVSILFAVKEKLYKEVIEIENTESQVNPITPEKVSGFVWEYWNGTTWEKFVPEDETDSFNKGGIITFNINTNIAVKTEFEKDRYWIRIIPAVANKISCPKLKGIFPNSVWAKNSTTVEDEKLGSGNGQPDQTLSFSKKPVLKEQIIEVKEAEVWVRWNEVKNFSLSDSLSRHYVLDRANGMIIFGNGVRGMLPPRGKNNILARKFMAGGSLWGNCKGGTIDQLKRKIPGIEKVTNNISASGGMDQENLKKAVDRGPHSLKNRDRAVTKEDFEWLAREASQDVAWAKCNPEMGKINIIIVPDSTDEKPLPEAGLLDEVKRHLEDRALLTIRNRITTFGPDYKMINATVKFKPEKLSESAAVSEDIKGKLKTFLHPVHGGQDKDGWDFGEKIFLSEAAAIIEGAKGVGSIKEINLEKFAYLFCWEDIPGNDNEKLKEYLTKKYNFDWVKDANIIKIDENNIKVSTADHEVTLTLNEDRNKVKLTIDDVGQTEKFIANPEKDKLNIFELKESKSGLGWITIEKDALPYAGHIEVIPEG